MRYLRYCNNKTRLLLDQNGNKVSVRSGTISGILSTRQFSDPPRQVFSNDIQFLSLSVTFRDASANLWRYTGVFNESDLLTVNSIVRIDCDKKFKNQSRIMNKHRIDSLSDQARELLGVQSPSDLFTIWIQEHEDHLVLRVGISSDSRQMSSYHGIEQIYDFRAGIDDFMWRPDYQVSGSAIVLGSASHVYLSKGQDLGCNTHDFPASPIEIVPA